MRYSLSLSVNNYYTMYIMYYISSKMDEGNEEKIIPLLSYAIPKIEVWKMCKMQMLHSHIVTVVSVSYRTKLSQCQDYLRIYAKETAVVKLSSKEIPYTCTRIREGENRK